MLATIGAELWRGAGIYLPNLETFISIGEERLMRIENGQLVGVRAIDRTTQLNRTHYSRS